MKIKYSFLKYILLISLFWDCVGSKKNKLVEPDEYLVAVEFIKTSQEFKNQIVANNLPDFRDSICISPISISIPKVFFIEEIINFKYKNLNDSLKEIKEDSILINEYNNFKNESGMLEQLSSISNNNCKYMVFFGNLSENMLIGKILKSDRFNNNYQELNEENNTNIFFILFYDNKKIIKSYLNITIE